MSTFGVHYRTGSPDQLGLWVAGFPGHWVAGSQNVTQFHVWYIPSHLLYTMAFQLTNYFYYYTRLMGNLGKRWWGFGLTEASAGSYADNLHLAPGR